VRWKILFYRIPQFIYESKSERIIEIGPHLPSYRKIKSGTFLMAHGDSTIHFYFFQILFGDSIVMTTHAQHRRTAEMAAAP